MKTLLILLTAFLLTAAPCWAGPEFLLMVAKATPAAPAAPALSSLQTDAGHEQITATWGTVSGATSYNLYYKAGSDPTTGSYDGKIAGAASPYTINGPLTAGTTYYVGVTAVGSGESVMSGTMSAVAAAAPAVSGLLGFESDTVGAPPSGMSVSYDFGGDGPVNANTGVVVTNTDFDTGSKSLKVTAYSSMWTEDGLYYYDWVILHMKVATLGNSVTFRYKNGASEMDIRRAGDLSFAASNSSVADGAWHTVTFDTSSIAGSNVDIEIVVVNGSGAPATASAPPPATVYIDNIQF